MRPNSFYQAQNIDLKLGADVNAIDVRSREVGLDDGSRLAFDPLDADHSENGVLDMPIRGPNPALLYSAR
jgi:NAD(P)H-nitrite reductase large subunit